MSNGSKFLQKMYEIRVVKGNEGFLTKNAVANMIKKEQNINLTPKDTKDALDELVSKGLVEKTSHGIRISQMGMDSFLTKKTKSKTLKIVTVVIVSLLILATSLYFVYS